MRITICWSDISGYMAACWRALAKQAGVQLKIIAFIPRAAGTEVNFNNDIVAGLECRLLDGREIYDEELIASLVIESRPEVVVIPGWFHEPYTKLAWREELSGARFVTGLDTQWKQTFRQRLARWKLRPFVKRMHAVIVAGERSYQRALALGVPEQKIHRGFYGIDYDLFAPLYERRRSAGPWPRAFIYTGRYHIDKGIDTLLAAHREYSQSMKDPWPLVMCGMGPMKGHVDAAAGRGVQDKGFLQPRDLPQALLEAGVFVIASRQEPWGAVIAEAMAAGLPAIATTACGASVELIQPYFNGMLIPPDDPPSLAAAMRWMHEHHAELPEMGLRAQHHSAAYSASMWATRWRAGMQIDQNCRLGDQP